VLLSVHYRSTCFLYIWMLGMVVPALTLNCNLLVITQAGQDHSMCSRKQAKITACVHASRPRSQHVFTQAGQDHSMCSRKQAKITACVHASRPRSQHVCTQAGQDHSECYTSRPRVQHVFTQAGQDHSMCSNKQAMSPPISQIFWLFFDCVEQQCG